MSYNSRVNAINANLRTFRDRIGALEVGSGPSPNGTVWTQSNVTSGMFSASCFGKGVWVAAGDTNLWWSTDGKTWTECTGSSGYSWTYVYFANGLFVGCAYASGLWYSTDGKSWTQSNVTSGTFYDICQGKGNWVAVGTGGIYSATDGKTWTRRNTASCKIACYANGFFVVAPANSSTKLYYSEDSTSWNSSSAVSSTNVTFNDIICANGVWMVCTSNGTYFTTNLGASWTRSKSGSTYSIHFANGLYVMCHQSGGLLYSTDYTLFEDGDMDLCFTRVYNDAGIWIGIEPYEGLMYSLDGMSWHLSNIDYDNAFAHVHNANGVWVACDGANGLYYSVTWENS